MLASGLLVTYFVSLRPLQAGYTTIYLLDIDKKAVNYPEYLVAGVNSTFTIHVGVENHLGRHLNNTQVLIKISNNVNPSFPVDAPVVQTLVGMVRDQTLWASNVTLSLNEPGDFLVCFELWIPDPSTGTQQFTGNFCALNVHVAI